MATLDEAVLLTRCPWAVGKVSSGMTIFNFFRSIQVDRMCGFEGKRNI